MFALIDVNNFYASCEGVFRPDLKGKPVVVLSNNDGCVIARNAEAKKLGVKMGSPYFQQQAFFQRNGIEVFSSNYALYGDMSQRVMSVLESLVPEVEIYSIDEAFLNLSGLEKHIDLTAFGHQLREQVKNWTHLTVGVGIAPTKTLAKLANHAAKQWKKTEGVVDLSEPLRQKKLMALMPVEEVWGVGRRLSKSLRASGIDTVLKLSEMEPAQARKNYSVVLERTVRELRGEPCLMLDDLGEAKQQILCSRSFGKRVTEYQAMREAVCCYAERAAEKLRKERRFCKNVSVFIKTSPHAEGEIYYGNSAFSELIFPVQDTRVITAQAVACLDRIWKPKKRYLKAGVILGDFYQQEMMQLNLFEEGNSYRNSESLMKVLDEINAKNGRHTIWFAGQGIERTWKMKQAFLSHAYTTRFSELPTVFAR